MASRSLTGMGDRHFPRAEDLEYEVSHARIWGGIHFRSAVEDGVEIGKKTAHHVLAHHFKPSNEQAPGRHAAFDRDGWRGGDLRYFAAVFRHFQGQASPSRISASPTGSFCGIMWLLGCST